MKRGPRYKRITPLRALELVREMRHQQGASGNRLPTACDDAERALADHVRNALTRRRR